MYSLKVKALRVKAERCGSLLEILVADCRQAWYNVQQTNRSHACRLAVAKGDMVPAPVFPCMEGGVHFYYQKPHEKGERKMEEDQKVVLFEKTPVPRAVLKLAVPRVSQAVQVPYKSPDSADFRVYSFTFTR